METIEALRANEVNHVLLSVNEIGAYTPLRRIVLGHCAYLFMMNEGDSFKFSNRMLARVLGVRERSVRNAMKAFIRDGLVRIEKRMDGGMNVYSLDMEKLHELILNRYVGR